MTTIPNHDPEALPIHDPGAIPEPYPTTIPEQFSELNSLINQYVVERARIEVERAVLVNALRDILNTHHWSSVDQIAHVALTLVGEEEP